MDEKKQIPEGHSLTLGGDYLVSKIPMDRLMEALDLVIAHFTTGLPLEPEDGAALNLAAAREYFRSFSGL